MVLLTIDVAAFSGARRVQYSTACHDSLVMMLRDHQLALSDTRQHPCPKRWLPLRGRNLWSFIPTWKDPPQFVLALPTVLLAFKYRAEPLPLLALFKRDTQPTRYRKCILSTRLTCVSVAAVAVPSLSCVSSILNYAAKLRNRFDDERTLLFRRSALLSLIGVFGRTLRRPCRASSQGGRTAAQGLAGLLHRLAAGCAYSATRIWKDPPQTELA